MFDSLSAFFGCSRGFTAAFVEAIYGLINLVDHFFADAGNFHQLLGSHGGQGFDVVNAGGLHFFDGLGADGRQVEAQSLVRLSLQARQEALSTAVARLLVQNNETERQAAARIHGVYAGVERNVYWFVAAMLVLILLAGLYVAQYNRRMFQEVAVLSARRSELARQLIAMQESIFRSISRELHDDFGQILTAVGSMLQRTGRLLSPGMEPVRAELFRPFAGSLRRAGTRLRISVQLVDTQTDFPLWTERYDREMADVFELQDEIAHKIAEALRLLIAPLGHTGTIGNRRRARRLARPRVAYHVATLKVGPVLRFHEHDVGQQMPQRVRILHHAAAKLDDRDLVTELPNPTHCFDQEVGLLNGILHDRLLEPNGR